MKNLNPINLFKMRITIILFIIVANLSIGFAQRYDRVAIYAIPISTSFAGDDIDANYIRVHYSYFFTSTDQAYIEGIYGSLFIISDTLQGFEHHEINSCIRLVIDFIYREEITSTILMNSGYVFYILGPPSKRKSYQLLGSELCKAIKFIPFFEYLIYEKINCN